MHRRKRRADRADGFRNLSVPSTTGKDENFIARVDPRTTSRGGDKIKVGLDVNRLHFFDVETEKTILSRD